MKKTTLADLCSTLEAMTIERSVDHGYAIVHFGHIDGQPTIAISTCRGNGESYLIQ